MKTNWIMVVVFFLLFVVIITASDILFFNSKYSNKLLYPKDCTFVTPSGYQIYYSNIKMQYAVKVMQFSDYYLYNGRRGITTIFSSISSPALFDDSCEAKGYLKAYLNQQKPKFK